MMRSRSPISALRTRRTKDLFKQLESRSLTAAEEEIIQQRVRRACLQIADYTAARANFLSMARCTFRQPTSFSILT